MSTHPSDVRVVAERLAYSLADGRTLFSDLTLGFGRERTGLTGANGTGKSTLVRLLAGELRPSAGTVVRSGSVGYLPQDFQLRAARPLADALGIADRHQSAGSLSGGQRLRAGLACALNGWHPPRLLLLDEPTNHLDLDSLEALEQVLRGYDGALLVVSHDAAFLEAIGIERRMELPAR